MTTRSGRNSAAWDSSRSMELWAVRALTRNRSGVLRRTSSACVPIEPVEPNRLTVGIRSPEVECFDDEVGGRQYEEQTVEAVEDAAVSRHQPAHVLQTQMPLDHRLAQVAERGDHGDDQPQHQ